MDLNLNDLIELLAGRRGDLQVGTIPVEVRKFFRCSREEVFLSKYSVRHIIERHGDHISSKDLLLIPKIPEQGMWVADRPFACSISFQNPKPLKRYLAAIKITKNHSRIYLSTLHKAKKRQTKANLRKGQLLRPHWV